MMPVIIAEGLRPKMGKCWRHRGRITLPEKRIWIASKLSRKAKETTSTSSVRTVRSGGAVLSDDGEMIAISGRGYFLKRNAEEAYEIIRAEVLDAEIVEE